MRVSILALGVLLGAVRSHAQCSDPAVCAATPSCSNSYVTCEDQQVAQQSNDAVVSFCTAEARGEVDAASAKQDLIDSMGGTNIFLEAAQESTSESEMGTKLQEKAEAQIAVYFAPLFFAILLTPLAICCCLWSCPCCKKIRCCNRAKEDYAQTHKLVRAASFIFTLLVVAGCIAGIAVASTGYNSMMDGFDNAICASAAMLNTTLQGQTGTLEFIGMTPALNIFNSMERSLDEGASFQNDINTVLDNTFDISKTVEEAKQVLLLMKDMMGDGTTANTQPVDGSGNRLPYECGEFCDQLRTALATAVTELEGGVGSALVDARAEVDDQLSGAKRLELQQTLSQGTQPMKEFKDQMRSMFKPFVEPGSFDATKESADGAVLAGICVFFLLAFLLAICGGLSSGCWVLRAEKAEGCEPDVNPYPHWPHRCACAGWCCGFLYVIVVMVAGGLLVGISVPVSAVCLIMDDMNKDMLLSIGAGTGMDFTDTQGEMLLDIIDNCLNPSDPNANANLLDLVFEVDETTGDRVSMRERVIGQVRDPIIAQFDAIETAEQDGGASLAASQPIVDLKDLISDNPIDAVTIVEASLDTALADMGNNALSIGLQASVACADHSITVSGSSTTPPPATGMEEFATELQNFGTATGAAIGPCNNVNKVTCSGTLATDDAAACAAGNHLMDKYSDMVNLNTFRCDVFVNEAGNECDPKNLNAVTGANSCVKQDGTMERRVKTCNFEEYKTYYADFETRIDVTFRNMDRVVGSLGDQVTQDLYEVVNNIFLVPLTEVVDGITCGWVAPRFQQMIDGLCYQGIWGFRKIGQAYVGCAVCVLFFVLGYYAVWRRTVDNVNFHEPPAPEQTNV